MNDSNEWKVRIFEDGPTGMFNIFIMSNSTGDVRTYISDAKKGECTTIKEGEALKPTMILSSGMLQAFFTALQGQGMKPIEQSFVEGKLEATEKHLHDMRDLVFQEKRL